MDNVVVIDGEIRLQNVIDGDADLTEVIDGSAYPVLRVSDGGTADYERLINKPKIESVVLIGDKSFEDLGLEELSGEDLIRILT